MSDIFCGRVGCGEPAVAVLLMSPQDTSAWIVGPAHESAPEGVPLCAAHADRISVPFGWTLTDDRPAPDKKRRRKKAAPSESQLVPEPEPESAADPEPEPPAHPVAAEPEAVAESAPADPDPEPAAVEPEPEPEPEPRSAAVEPEPEPAAVEPEPAAVEPAPAVEPVIPAEPAAAAEPEPVAVEPEPEVAPDPEPAIAELEREPFSEDDPDYVAPEYQFREDGELPPGLDEPTMEMAAISVDAPASPAEVPLAVDRVAASVDDDAPRLSVVPGDDDPNKTYDFSDEGQGAFWNEPDPAETEPDDTTPLLQRAFRVVRDD